MGLYQGYGNYADSANFAIFFFIFFPGQFSNAISSEVSGPIDFKFRVRHPGRVSTNVMEIMLVEHFLPFFRHFLAEITL